MKPFLGFAYICSSDSHYTQTCDYTVNKHISLTWDEE